MRKTVNLVDVPGLGDTKGIKEDNRHLANIKLKLDK
jgi:predicted GTPase